LVLFLHYFNMDSGDYFFSVFSAHGYKNQFIVYSPWFMVLLAQLPQLEGFTTPKSLILLNQH
jgi:hypothetical protein